MNLFDPIISVLGAIAEPIAKLGRAISPEFFGRMGNDFASWLLILSVFTGVIYLLDRLVLEKRRKTSDGSTAKPNWLVDFGRQFFPVIFAVFILRAFIVEPFRIPSGSMIPTLRVGDFILVNRFAYGLRCPVGDCVLWGAKQPQRGDVVVFRYPVDPKIDFIKRVVGLPGDVIEYRNKQLIVNGKPVPQTLIGKFEGGLENLYAENIGGVDIQTLQNPDRPAMDFPYTVPAGHYFAMGDNRDGSSDSRFWGPVPEGLLKGRAFMIWMSYNSEAPTIAQRVVTQRIGQSIR